MKSILNIIALIIYLTILVSLQEKPSVPQVTYVVWALTLMEVFVIIFYDLAISQNVGRAINFVNFMLFSYMIYALLFIQQSTVLVTWLMWVYLISWPWALIQFFNAVLRKPS